VSIDIHRQWGSLSRFGDPYWHVDFTPEHVSIVAHDGRTVADRDRPRAAFYGHTPTTPWDLLDRAYFHGCALWTYLTVPFVFAQPGFKLVEICPLRAGEDIWRGLRVRFPDWIATHSREQDFYFGPDRLLRRHDYQLDVAGGLPAAQLVSEFTEAQGIRFPIFQRAYRRGEDMTPLLHRPLVSMNLDDFVLR